MRPVGEGDAVDLREMQKRMVYHTIAYVHALRQQLRRVEPWVDIVPLLPEAEVSDLRGQHNVAVGIMQELSLMLRESLSRGWVDPMQWKAIDQNLDDLIDAQGGAERIKTTPMPRQYDYFPQLFVEIFCLLLPLSMVSSLGWFTPLGSSLVGFIFLALDKVGRDLEDPFDNTPYDIPLTAITRTIEINLRQQLGETEVPAASAPVNGVLW
jgi:putative membrane protein